jgi:hypothetical protein
MEQVADCGLVRDDVNVTTDCERDVEVVLVSVGFIDWVCAMLIESVSVWYVPLRLVVAESDKGDEAVYERDSVSVGRNEMVDVCDSVMRAVRVRESDCVISALCVRGSVFVEVTRSEFVTIIELVTSKDLVVVIGTDMEVVTSRDRVMVLVARHVFP